MIRLYRFLLRLLPGPLRRRFGPEMEADLRRRLAEAPDPRRRRAAARGAVADLLASAVTLRAAALADVVPGPDSWVPTLRQAARSLRRRPGLAAGASATLGLAVALVLVAFTVLDGALLRPLPYAHADRLAMVNGAASSPDEVARWAGRVPGLEGAAAFTLDQAVASTAAGAREAAILAVAPGFLDLVGVPVEEGRRLTDDEIASGAPVVLVARRLWRSVHGEAHLDGQTLELDGTRWAVAGIVPDAFAFARYEREIYRGIGFAGERGWVSAAARLAPDATLEGVVQALEQGGAGATVTGAAPGSAEAPAAGRRVSAHLLAETLRSELRGPLWVLLAAAGLVLVIAGANVASLAIARDLERRPELAVRRALGAARGHIAGQIVAEGMLLALAGGALGALLAPPLRDALLRAAPRYIPGALDLTPGPRAWLAALAAVAGVTVLTGVLPAALAWGRSDAGLRRGMGRRARSAGRWMRGLVAVEAALATGLVVGSVLLLRTFAELRPTEPGFAVRDRLAVEIRLPERLYGDDGSAARGDAPRAGPADPTTGDAAVRAFGLALLDAAAGLEGRPAAALVTYLPLSGVSAYLPVRRPDADPDARPVMAHHRAVSAGYRRLMEMELVRGRDLTEADDAGAPRVAVLNRRAARTLWPEGGDPLGRAVRLDAGGGEQPYTVVGIVADARILGGTTDSRPEVWTAFRQTPQRRFTWLLAGGGAAAGGAAPLPDEATVRRAVEALDPGVPVASVETLAQVVGRSMVVPRFQLALLGTLTGAGLLLAALGSFAVLAFRVRGIRRELGIRQALGAAPRGLVGRVLGGALLLALPGAAAGALSTWLAAGWIGSRLYLYGVEPREAAPYLVALGVVAAITLAGAAAPALRAARTDAVDALREAEA